MRLCEIPTLSVAALYSLFEWQFDNIHTKIENTQTFDLAIQFVGLSLTDKLEETFLHTHTSSLQVVQNIKRLRKSEYPLIENCYINYGGGGIRSRRTNGE